MDYVRRKEQGKKVNKEGKVEIYIVKMKTHDYKM